MPRRSSFLPLIILIGAASFVGCNAPGSRQAGAGFGAAASGPDRSGLDPASGAIIGTVAGGLVSGAVGSALDEEERRQLALASEIAAEQQVAPAAPPRRIAWRRVDPKTNSVTASGWVVPKSQPYQRPDRTTCRDIRQTVIKAGQTQSQDVTVCRTQAAQADGSNWVIGR